MQRSGPEVNIVVTKRDVARVGQRVSEYLRTSRANPNQPEVDAHDQTLQRLAGRWETAQIRLAKAEGNEKLAAHIAKTPFYSY